MTAPFELSSRHRAGIAIGVGLIIGVGVISSVTQRNEPDDIPLTDLLHHIDNGDVQAAELRDDQRSITVTLDDGRTLRSGYPQTYADTLLERLRAEPDVTIDVDRSMPPNPLWSLAMVFLPIMLLIGVVLWVIRRGGLGAAATTKVTTQAVDTKITTRFQDVIGCDEAVDDLREVVNYLQDPSRYRQLGARPPRGVLLTGPPGTGKTLLAKAVAGEAGVPYFAVNGSDFVELYVGVGASRVRKTFAKAREADRAIVFIDEIDAVGRRRGGSHSSGSNEERENTLNALLVEMDGFTNSNVVVIAATNRSDVLDAALLRSGRFDRQITVSTPDRRGRHALFRSYLHTTRLADDVDIDALSAELAGRSSGLSGADIANVVNEAALAATRDQRSVVERTHLHQALERVVLGRERHSLTVSDRMRRITAWHEAGHALCGLVHPDAPRPQRVSIIPRGQAGGVTWFDNTDDMLRTRRELHAQLVVAFSGRVGEELLLDGDFTQGAENDIAQATAIAEHMVGRWAMTSGRIACHDAERSLTGPPDDVRTEVETLLRDAWDQARHLLTSRRDDLERIAQRLLDVDTLDEHDLVEMGF